MRDTKPHCVAKQKTHRATRRVDRRLAATGRIKPGAVDAGDDAIEGGDRGDQGGHGFRRQVLIRLVVAARMEVKARGLVQGRDAAGPKIRLGDRAMNGG